MATQAAKNSAGQTVTLDELAAQLSTLKEEIGTLTRNAGAYSRQQSQRAVDEARSNARDAVAKGEEHLHAAQNAVAKLPDDAALMVRERPLAALGVAAGVGLLVGLLSGRK
ncbi:DUF883 family protein [Algicella marina]|nr:DUF883 family protein [Algicella marina]